MVGDHPGDGPLEMYFELPDTYSLASRMSREDDSAVHTISA